MLIYKRLKKLYPNTSEEYIEKAVKYIKESELLISHSNKLKEITDEELKMYYEEIIYDLHQDCEVEIRKCGK